jgi:hypothetical protein
MTLHTQLVRDVRWRLRALKPAIKALRTYLHASEKLAGNDVVFGTVLAQAHQRAHIAYLRERLRMLENDYRQYTEFITPRS